MENTVRMPGGNTCDPINDKVIKQSVKNASLVLLDRFGAFMTASSLIVFCSSLEEDGFIQTSPRFSYTDPHLAHVLIEKSFFDTSITYPCEWYCY